MTELQTKILELFQDPDTSPKETKDIYQELGYARKPAKLEEALAGLVEDCRLMNRGGKYFHPRLMGCVAGTYWDSGRNFGFVTPDGVSARTADIFLPPHCSGRAWHGDRVLVELDPRSQESGRETGHVIRVICRGVGPASGESKSGARSIMSCLKGGGCPS